MLSRLCLVGLSGLSVLLFWPAQSSEISKRLEMSKHIHMHLGSSSKISIDTANPDSQSTITSFDELAGVMNQQDSQVIFRQASAVALAEPQSQLAKSFTENVVEGVFLNVQLVENTRVTQPLDDSFVPDLENRPQDEPTKTTNRPVRAINHKVVSPPLREQDQASYSNIDSAQRLTHPAMHVSNYRLLQYRRLMSQHEAPHPTELQGTWRGINKGIATVAIDQQFVKRFYVEGGQVYGDNISVQQLPNEMLGQSGWQTIYDPLTGTRKSAGKFLVQNPQRIGTFRNGVVLNYRKGGNRKLDPSRLIEDKLVKLDDNHMLGRATAKFGPIKIPLAYFVIERIQE